MTDGLDRLGRIVVQALLDVRGDDHAVVGGDAEEGDETDPDRHREVHRAEAHELRHALGHEGQVPPEPQDDDPAAHGYGDAAEDGQRDGAPSELQVQEHEDEGDGHRNEDRQTLLAADLVLVGAGEREGDARRAFDLLVVDRLLEARSGGFHRFDLRDLFLLVEEDVGRREGVFALDHLRAADVLEGRELLEGDLLAHHRGDPDAADRLDAVPLLPRVSHPHREALAPFDGAGHGLTAQGRLDHPLDRLDGQPVASDGFAVEIDLEVGLAHDPVGEDRLRP